MRRYTAYMSGERFLGDTGTKVIHDLEKEKPQCMIDEVIRSGNEHPYKSLKEAYADGYSNCSHCIKSKKYFPKVFNQTEQESDNSVTLKLSV